MLGTDFEVYIIEKFDNVCKKFSLYTNGTLLSAQIEKMDFSKISFFQVSIDGTDDVMRMVNHYYEGSAIHDILKSIDNLRKNENTQIAISIGKILIS